MTELKRCPFCGSKNIKIDSVEISCPQEIGSYAECLDCKSTIEVTKPHKVIDTWNTRPIEDELNARIAQLTAERDEWKADAERLAKNHLSIIKANQFICSYCGYIETNDDGTWVHQDTCPITLHRELVAKYGTSDADITG